MPFAIHRARRVITTNPSRPLPHCGRNRARLADDPPEAGPAALEDVRVRGTVVGGRIFPAPS